MNGMPWAGRGRGTHPARRTVRILRHIIYTTAVLLPAAAILVPAAPASAATTTVCNTYCDARDPSLAVGDRQAASVTVSGRDIILHISDGDDMAWGAILDGAPGDTVWLDRSFDGGQTWANGSKLGDTTIPSGDTGWRTLMYNADNWNTGGVGLLRACGEPAGGSSGFWPACGRAIGGCPIGGR